MENSSPETFARRRSGKVKDNFIQEKNVYFMQHKDLFTCCYVSEAATGGAL